MTRSKTRRALPFIALVVLSFLAVRAVASDEIKGFLDGMVAGFTNGV